MTDALKVGDLIATNKQFGRGVDLHRVEKVTPTMYVTKGYRFRRDGLRIVGASGYGPFNGRIPTADDVLKSRIQRATAALRTVEVDEHNIEAVEALFASASPPKGDER